MIEKPQNEIVKVDDNRWKFPVTIQFETAASYHDFFNDIKYDETVIFDMKETDALSSSFIGFLLDIKHRVEKNGGKLQIISSEPVDKLFKVLKLFDYFFSE